MSQLLIEMDSLLSFSASVDRSGGGRSGGCRVVVLAATNVPQAVDPALLRPGG